MAAGRALSRPGIAGLAASVMVCLRCQTLDSRVNCGSEGNGRRSSRS